MIQVYKKNELFIIENTVTDTLYPNLTREEAIKLEQVRNTGIYTACSIISIKKLKDKMQELENDNKI